MVKLHFKSTQEFEEVFKSKGRKVTDAIVEAIEEAMQNGKKTAHLFEITFEDVEIAYDISLPQSQWKHALQSSLETYEELKLVDECIDTWKLLELAKVW